MFEFRSLGISHCTFIVENDGDNHGGYLDDPGIEEVLVVFAGKLIGVESLVRLLRASVTMLCLILCHPLVSHDQVLFPNMCVMGTAP